MPSIHLDQNQLFERAVSEGTAAFTKAISKYPKERFYAFCFYTDNDVTSIYPHANTREGLKRIYAGRDSEERNYYKWAPAEWGLNFGQYGRRDLMVRTNKLLHPDDREPEETPRSFGARKKQTIVTLTKALLAIRDAKVFQGHSARKKLAFWVNIGDSDTHERKWMLHPSFPHLDSVDVRELKRLFEIR